MTNIYDPVARLYDGYVTTDQDLAFFRQEAGDAAGPILEIMAGTGRVSVALGASGRHLICLDLSPGMLEVLRGKIHGAAGRIDPVCADARALPLMDSCVGLTLIPFNSFAELTLVADQNAALAGIARCLKPRGRFICTLHNPLIRSRTLDGVERLLGEFPVPAEPGRQVEVRIVESLDRRSGLARSRQRYLLRDVRGREVERREQVVEFALTEPDDLIERGAAAGLEPIRTYGDYDRSPFDPALSRYMIAVFEKR